MYPSRGPCRRADLCDTHGCDLGDRVAPRHSAGNAGERFAAARRVRFRRRAGSSDGPGCAGCRPRSGHDNARTRARHRSRASRTNCRKVGCRASRRDTARTIAAHFDECSRSNLKARSSNSGPSSLWGLRSCLEWCGQVEFLAGIRPPVVRWKWSRFRPVAAPSGSLSCRARAPITRQRGSLSCRQVDQ